MSNLVFIVLGLIVGVGIGIARTRRPKIQLPEPETRGIQESVTGPPFEGVLESLPLGVIVASASGKVIFKNTLSDHLTGSIHADVLIDEAVEIHIANALAGTSSHQILDLFGPPRKVVHVSTAPLLEGGAIATVEDITDRFLVDAVRTDFVANISHELKTPVGALVVLAEAISGEDDLEIIHRLSLKMVDQAFRVSRIIDDLLELSRIEFGGEQTKEVVDTQLIVEQSISRARPLAELHCIEIAILKSAEPLMILGDVRQLVSAIGNLVENAVKYSEAGSKVEVSFVSDSSWVEIRVTDHGVGIPMRDLDRVFERFYRVDRARSRDTGGTGLGLAIVRHIAGKHGGEVSVTSIEGEGSTFIFKVPAFVH